MLQKDIYTQDRTTYYEYDPFEKVKRMKDKLDEALEEYYESFERKDFYS